MVLGQVGSKASAIKKRRHTGETLGKSLSQLSMGLDGKTPLKKQFHHDSQSVARIRMLKHAPCYSGVVGMIPHGK